jgi:CRISPR system Cascade subunit CasA
MNESAINDAVLDPAANFDLRQAPWLPLRRRSGAIAWSRISAIVDHIGATGSTDPVVEVAAPRADLSAGLLEWLIGVLTVTMRPQDEAEWQQTYHNPPTSKNLDEALGLLPDAFRLGGDGPRVLQDYTAADFADSADEPIEQLLADSPGGQTIDQNADLFVKRRRLAQLGPSAAAMALITIQTYAPSGGRGHRTSMRGGGPLTTLVDPRTRVVGATARPGHRPPLWDFLWSNVLPIVEHNALNRASPLDPARVFPWLAPTRRSEGDRGTVPADGHPYQCFFGMPRRVRLVFGQPGRCDLTGEDVPFTVTAYRARPYGVKYDSWRHPHSPYVHDKLWLSMHGQPGGVGWRDWPTLMLRDATDDKRTPARVISYYRTVRARQIGIDRGTLVAFGYDFDKMKARSWVSAQIRLAIPLSADHAAVLASFSDRAVEATGLAASMLIGAIGRTRSKDSGKDGQALAAWRTAFWDATAPAFDAALRRLGTSSNPVHDELTEVGLFSRELRSAVQHTFERACPLDDTSLELLKRRVHEEAMLDQFFRGNTPLGKKLFALLGQPVPVRRGGSAQKKGRKSII